MYKEIERFSLYVHIDNANVRLQPRRAAQKGRLSIESEELYVVLMVEPYRQIYFPIRVFKEEDGLQVPGQDDIERPPVVVLDEQTQHLAVEWRQMVMKSLPRDARSSRR
jgi:hypothetical protein